MTNNMASIYLVKINATLLELGLDSYSEICSANLSLNIVRFW